MSSYNQCANLMHDIGLAQSHSIWDGCRKPVGCGAVTLPVLRGRIVADTRCQQIATALDDLAVLQRLLLPLGHLHLTPGSNRPSRTSVSSRVEAEKHILGPF